MAYPSGTEWRAVSPVIGSQPIGSAETAARHSIGYRTRAHDHTYGDAEFVYLLGAASTAKGDLVAFDAETGATKRAYKGMRGQIAVAMSACDAGQYGWYAVKGAIPVLSAASGQSGLGFLSTTTSSVDVNGEEGERIDGLSVAVASGGFSTAKLNHPSANGSDSDASERKG